MKIITGAAVVFGVLVSGQTEYTGVMVQRYSEVIVSIAADQETDEARTSGVYVLDYPEGYLRYRGVEAGDHGEATVADDGNQLTVTWSSAEGAMLQEGDAYARLRFEAWRLTPNGAPVTIEWAEATSNGQAVPKEALVDGEHILVYGRQPRFRLEVRVME